MWIEFPKPASGFRGVSKGKEDAPSTDCTWEVFESNRPGGGAETFVLQTNRKYGRKTIHDHRFGKARGAEYVHHRAGGLY